MPRAATAIENRSSTDRFEFLVQKVGLFVLTTAILGFGVGLIFVISTAG